MTNVPAHRRFDESAAPSQRSEVSMLPLVNGAAASIQPEKRLMLAVLDAAVSDFQRYATAWSGRGRRLFAEADGWVRSDATDQPFDFENICQTLGFDSSFIRAGLRRWRIARLQEASAAMRSVDGGGYSLPAEARPSLRGASRVVTPMMGDDAGQGRAGVQPAQYRA